MVVDYRGMRLGVTGNGVQSTYPCFAASGLRALKSLKVYQLLSALHLHHGS